MPSWKLRKRKPDPVDVSTMATGGRYIRKDHDHHRPSPRLTEQYSSSTVIRNVTTQRKSEQTKGSRSHSVPSLNSMDVTIHHTSPTRTPRSNSVRGYKSTAPKSVSIKKKIAKMFGSHSDLSGKALVPVEQTSSGVYKQIGGFRPRSIGGSSDCSSSSLTSTNQQQSELSRNNSLRDSTRSRISQGSVFSTSRQGSYDSTDAINISALGTNVMVPSESGLRPRSIACMQRSGSSTSLRINSVDPRYHSIATVPTHSVDPTPFFDRRCVRGTVRDDPELEETSGRVKPSDPGYKKMANDLMTCSPHPPPQDKPLDGHMERVGKYSGDGLDNIPSRPINSHGRTFESRQNMLTPVPDGAPDTLPYGWEVARAPNGLSNYYIDHNTQTTHWKLPNDPEEENLADGWELVKSKKFGTYYVNHNNCTAQYQHPVYSRPPPSYHHYIQTIEEDEVAKDRKGPIRSHSHRGSQNRVVDPSASLPRRSKSFRDGGDVESQGDHPLQTSSETYHTRQLSTMTYVPPSPFSIMEIPRWLKDYVDTPPGTEQDTNIQWNRYSPEDLNGLDTMIKRLLKKNTEQFVKSFEYYRVALQKEIDSRQKSIMAGAREQQTTPTQKPIVPTPDSLPRAFPDNFQLNHVNHTTHSLLSNGISASPPSYSSRPDHTQKTGGVSMYRTSSMPPVASRHTHYNKSTLPHPISSYQKHLITNNNPITSQQYSPNTSDVYDGLPETFV